MKLRGRWVYLYRAVDRAGQTMDFRLSAKRDVAAAKAFFNNAINSQRRPPQTIAPDGYAASDRAVREMKADGVLPENTTLRSSKYLNNLIEQDHRNIKSKGGRQARLQAIQEFGCHHRRIRTHAPNSKGAVQHRGTLPRNRCARCLEGRPSA